MRVPIVVALAGASGALLPPLVAARRGRAAVRGRLTATRRATPARRAGWGLVVGLGALTGVGGLVLMAPLLAVGAVVLGVTVWWVRRGMRRRDVPRRIDAELPAVLDLVAAGVRSGRSVSQAWCDAAGLGGVDGHLADDLLRLRAELESGVGVHVALSSWSRARPTPGVALVVAASTLAIAAGGRARPVDAVAATLRERTAIDRELHAISAQARASAMVMILAPVLFTVLAGIGDPAAWAFLVRTPVGQLCLVTGIALDAMGAGWLWRLAQGDS